jgi:hypothetical protein
MGETINHHLLQWHSGIDFQWLYEAPITTVLDGEIVDIMYDDKTDSHSLQITTGEFMVQYEIAKLHLLNPSFTVGDKVLSWKPLGDGYPDKVWRRNAHDPLGVW